MSTPILTFAPKIGPEAPPWLRQHLTLIYQKLGNHTQAMSLQSQKIAEIKAGATTIIQSGGTSGGGGGGGGGSTVPIGGVNDQSGVTSYATASGDDASLIVLSDASAIAVSLTTQTPPWFCWISNQGVGTATLTPASGTISYAANAGAASMPLLGGYGAIVAFDGTNWWASTSPIVPVNTPAVTHEWITGYDATTGVFSLSQPAFSDISGTATTAQIGTGTPAAGDYVDGGTGAWTSLPALPAPILSGATGSMGGSPMTVGETITATATVTGAAAGMVPICCPQTYPGDGFDWDAYVSAANTVTARLTCVLAGTPVASVYSVRVIQ